MLWIELFSPKAMCQNLTLKMPFSKYRSLILSRTLRLNEITRVGPNLILLFLKEEYKTPDISAQVHRLNKGHVKRDKAEI